MNVANLQLEGLLMSVAAVNNALVRALKTAEAAFTGDQRLFEDMSPANRDAVCFPLRLLQLANTSQFEAGVPPFFELAKQVGITKQPYNDQM
ncbi:hypothetical protein [Mesorhizobium neociceri]|uniref:Uncharacterized protein n=1 Tax=Mesorhizobium neociceri TaxID=1307853 RepID=A0A838BF08_9HYPH|nr:hypothetical protein [Mesorhizobium neociceri]MBA1144481.1 hypothetical protein [Mesorhizobium neociceri]